MPEKLFSAAVLTVAAFLLVSCAKTPETSAEASPLPEIKIGSAIDTPYFYMGEDGHYTGLDKEIADEACRRMGYTPVYTVFTWGEQDTLLENGTVDCIWECFAMNGREDMYQWAGPYMTEQEKIVVAADSSIYTLDDLAGKTLAVRIDSKGEDYFLKEGGTAILSDPDTLLCTFDNMADTFSYFGKGYADAVAGHYLALAAMTQAHPDLYRFLDENLMELKLGVAFSKEHDAATVQQLTQTLNDMAQDGTIAAIVARYNVPEEKAGAADGL